MLYKKLHRIVRVALIRIFILCKRHICRLFNKSHEIMRKACINELGMTIDSFLITVNTTNKIERSHSHGSILVCTLRELYVGASNSIEFSTLNKRAFHSSMNIPNLDFTSELTLRSNNWLANWGDFTTKDFAQPSIEVKQQYKEVQDTCYNKTGKLQ